MVKLGLKDQKILYELEKDARQPLSKIAKKLNISKQLLGYKIKRMEEIGLIQGYNAIIDTSKMGYITYRAYLKLQQISIGKEKEFLDFLKNMPEIAILVKIDGRWDVGLGIMVKNIYDFYDCWNRIMKYKEYIETYNITIYSPIYHFTRTFLASAEEDVPKTLILGGKEKVEVDKLDIEILSEFAPNIRKPLIKTAHKLKKSGQLIINRIRSLEEKGILQGYRPILNLELIGYTYYKVDINLLSYRQNQDLFNYCKGHRYIFQIDKTIGGSDFEIEIYAKSRKHFREIMQEIKDKFDDVFKNYTYFTVIRTLKETFFPIDNIYINRKQ